jgi:uncharacterized protein (UPF0248 family)
MIPIQDLLNRIRWDDAFATGYFVIGYHDRISGEIVQVPLQDVEFVPGNHFFFQFHRPQRYRTRGSPSSHQGSL